MIYDSNEEFKLFLDKLQIVVRNLKFFSECEFKKLMIEKLKLIIEKRNLDSNLIEF